MEKDLKVAMPCAATEVTVLEENVGWNAVSANFIGVVLFNAKNVIEKSK